MFAILTSNCYKYLFHNAQTNKGEIGLYFCYNERWYFVKVQLISKQNCRAINSPKKQTLDFYFYVYYFKVSTKESLSSFVIQG